MLWRLHRRLLAERLDEAVATIQAFGDELQLVDGLAVQCAPPLDCPYRPGLALTTLQDAQAIYGRWEATPGLFYHPSAYAVSRYLPQLEADTPMLNPAPLFVPCGLMHRLSALSPAALAGAASTLFIRPDSGNKPFAGQCVPVVVSDTWADVRERFTLAAGEPSTTSMLCLSPGQPVDPTEWRFWIVDGQVVASSGYTWSEQDIEVLPPPAVIALAKQVAAGSFQIDRAYVCDIATVNGQPLVCELNAASTSGLYQCDIGALFAALRACAFDEWGAGRDE